MLEDFSYKFHIPMPAVLYQRERELLAYLIQFQEQNGFAPTLSEMARAMNRKSPSTIHALIRTLVDKGYIQKVDGNTRTLKILKKQELGSTLGSITRAAGPSMSLPLLGYIVAGRPLEPHIDPEATFEVANNMISGQRPSFVLQVKGSSMIEDGIMDGDYVVIEKVNAAQNGDIVVALVDENLATLKRYYDIDGKIILKPANADMDPIYPKTVKIQGRVVGLVRKFQIN